MFPEGPPWNVEFNPLLYDPPPPPPPPPRPRHPPLPSPPPPPPLGARSLSYTPFLPHRRVHGEVRCAAPPLCT